MPKKIKAPKSIAQTMPTVYVAPFRTMEYIIIQDVEQLRRLGKSCNAVADSMSDGIDGFKAIARTLYNPGYGYLGLIYYPGMLEDDLTSVMRTLCHECVHIWQGFSEEVICEESPGAEFEAYTIDEFFGNAIQEYYRLVEINENYEAYLAQNPSAAKAS